MRTLSRFVGFGTIAFLFSFLLGACNTGERTDSPAAYDASQDSLRFENETHLRNVKQLTFGGNNAEAYWSFDDSNIIFQSDWSEINDQGCDQIYVMDPTSPGNGEASNYKLVSTGMGRTTCSYFLPDGRIVFGSTHSTAKECPPTAMFEQGRYVWPIYESYDIYIANGDGSGIERLIGGEGYDAEATVSPDGKYIIFTSTRSGDLELWRFEIETGDVLQLTDTLGYDGGAFFSRDSSQIVWRASRPEGEEAELYRGLLEDGFVEPAALNLYVANIDGSNARQVTDLPGANWAPFFHPSGEQIIFTTNHHSMEQGGRLFDLFLINTDGTGLEQVTYSGTFDAFPMFSFNGTRIAFSSNRNVARTETRDTNVFVAEWVD